MSLATPLLREHVCTIIRAGWCQQRAQTPPALLSMRSWKMLTPGLSLIPLNCMEGIIVILRISGKAGTVIFLMLCRVCVSPLGRTADPFNLASVAVLYDMCRNLLIHNLCVAFLSSVCSLIRDNSHGFPLAWNLFCGIHYGIILNGNIWKLSYHTAPPPPWPHYGLYWNAFISSTLIFPIAGAWWWGYILCIYMKLHTQNYTF